jgi:putative pyruvate formate lyase activating enzyme
MFKPAYMSLYESGELFDRIGAAYRLMEKCRVCARRCETERLSGKKGKYCRTGLLPMVSAYHPHFGEERPLVGTHGSGTIFITSCSLRCVFCQNWEISHLQQGAEVSLERFAEMMVELQEVGCHNINFVTPTHVVPQILGALPYAIEGGLRIPLVYNTGGYDTVEALQLLDGVFDLYMPDLKFSDPKVAERLCKAEDYPEVSRTAVKEMHRQVGDLVMDERGIAERGLLVRHLVMPGGKAGIREVMRFIARELSRNTYVNIMDQYRPWGNAFRFPEINRRITSAEYEEAVRIAHEEGLYRLDSEPRVFVGEPVLGVMPWK